MAAFTECHLERENTWLSKVSKLETQSFWHWCNFYKEVCFSRPVHVANTPDPSNRESVRLLVNTSGTLFSGPDVVRPGYFSGPGSSRLVALWLQSGILRGSKTCLVTVSENRASLASGEALSCLCLLHLFQLNFIMHSGAASYDDPPNQAF